MSTPQFNLASAARAEMIHEGFDPDFPPGTEEQLAAIKSRPPLQPPAGVRDLRNLLWSSIDNDTSRDLDQVEFAERIPSGIKVLVGIADVDSAVPKDSPIDQHAASQTITVYTTVRTFPMIPEVLSTDLTSLEENEDRAAIVIEFVVKADGSFTSPDVYRALIRNRAQLAYNATGAWLEGRAQAPPKVAASADLQAQLKLQDEAATALRAERHRLGALNFDRVETIAIVTDGQVHGIQAARKTRANDLIEDFMIAANEVTATMLTGHAASMIRRVVKTPERWPRIVELAARYNEQLPEQPDSAALNAFLERRRAADPVHYPDISLAVVKLMGPGAYILQRPNDTSVGHFGLAVQDYTHSTAPNRRFSDLVTQRLLKGVWAKQAPYSDGELADIARNCTLKEDAARKVERTMMKRITAVALHDRIGQTFAGVITGVSDKGVFVRVFDPPAEGRVIRGEAGLDVGDQVRVTLLNTDPQRGFIDFGRA
ncbi:MAG: Exoribonuclease [Bryobacterales bacterium]|nr:Exoribonuclease [Bryobacterales bacterium]